MSRRRSGRAGSSGYPRINSSMPSPGVVEGRPTLRLVEACEENHVAPPRLGNMYAAEEVGYSESETETTTGQVSHSIKLLKWSRPYNSDTSHGKAGQHTRSS